MKRVKKWVACALSSAMLLVWGPVNLAGETFGPPSTDRRTVVLWEGGDVVEHRYAGGEMGLRVRLGGRLVEFRARGFDIDTLEVSVLIDGVTRYLDYDNLARGMFDSALSRQNLETLEWIASETEHAPFALAPASQERLLLAVSTASDALTRFGVPRGCVGSAGLAVGAGGTWLVCIATAAATAGGTLVPCFVAGAIAYFFTVQAAIDCDSEEPCPDCPDDPGGGDGRCDSDLPPCMGGCDLDPGDACACSCPGEACCDWPDAP